MHQENGELKECGKRVNQMETLSRNQMKSSHLEVLQFCFLVDSDPEPKSYPDEPELESPYGICSFLGMHISNINSGEEAG